MVSDPFDVVVVGSLNQDLVASVPRIPAPGETVMASGHAAFAGGKGANQATAAARLGASVSMVGRVGNDAIGMSLREGLERDGVDVSRVIVDDESATGLALINVDDSGENAITVSPGANGRLSAADVAAAAVHIEAAAVVLIQLEIPIAAVARAAELARGTVILNPAPAVPLPVGVLENVDILVPNENELGLLAGMGTATEEEVIVAARSLPADDVVVTLGARGALVVSRAGATQVSPIAVEPVDTTGAGDAFCGALAAELARGAYVQAAARFAARVAAVAVTRHGAQASMPTREDL